MQGVIYEKTTPETMQECVDAWIQDMKYGIMGLRNTKVYLQSPYVSEAQKEDLMKVVVDVEKALQAIRKVQTHP